MGLSSDDALLSGLFGDATVGMALVGTDGRWLRINPAMCRMLGYEERELSTQHFQGITHPDDRYKDASFVEKLIAGESDGYRVEKRYVHKDGHVVWAEVAASRIRTKAKDYYLFVSHDIGSRKEMEQALHRSEESFRTLIEGAPDAVCVHVDGQIRYVNPAFARLLGKDRADHFVGRIIGELLPPSDRLRLGVQLQSTGNRRTYDARFIGAGGRQVYCEVSELPIIRENEAAKILFLRDLTDREESFRKLLRADRLAAMGTLAAGIAHEINNPLALVVANLELGLEQLAEGDRRTIDLEDLGELLREAREGALRVRNVVRNMRQLSSPDGVEGEAVLVDIPAALDAALNLLWNQLKHRAVLSKEVDPVPRIRARAEEAEQLLINLLMHAGRSSQTDARLVSITVRVRFVGGSVMIEVLDSHAPLSVETREHIFDPFYSSGSQDQVGLGLAVSHSLVKQMGGEISAEQSGAGNLVRVLLPPVEKPKANRPDASKPESVRPPASDAVRVQGPRRTTTTRMPSPSRKKR